MHPFDKSYVIQVFLCSKNRLRKNEGKVGKKRIVSLAVKVIGGATVPTTPETTAVHPARQRLSISCN